MAGPEEKQRTTRPELDKMVDGSNLSTQDGTNRFLDSVRQHLDSVKPEDRKLQLDYLTAKLESENKLPQLLINSELTKADSKNYIATTSDGKNIVSADIKRMAEQGKNGIDDVNAARQLLAGALCRKFSDIDATGDKYAPRDVSGQPIKDAAVANDGKINATEISRWSEREKGSSVKLDDGSFQSKGEYERVLKELGTAQQLRDTFGTDKPNKEQIQKAIDADSAARRALEKIDPDGKKGIVKAAVESGAIWSDDKLSAANYLNTPKHFDRIRGIDNSVFSDSFVNAEKLAEAGKKINVSAESMAQKNACAQELGSLQKQLDAADKKNAEAAKEKTPEQKREEAMKEELNKLRAEIEKLKGGKPEAAKPEAAKPEAAKPEAAKPEAAKPQAAKPEAAKPEAAKPQAAKPEAAKPEAAKPEAAKPEAAKPEAAKPQAAKPEAAKPEAAKPQAAKPEAAKPEAAKPEAAKPEAAKPEAAKPEAAKPEATSADPTAEQLQKLIDRRRAQKKAG